MSTSQEPMDMNMPQPSDRDSASNHTPNLNTFPNKSSNESSPHTGSDDISPSVAHHTTIRPPAKKMGRPRKAKDAVLVPKRPVGRPRKEPSSEAAAPTKKRPVGRPRKYQGFGEVRVEFNNMDGMKRNPSRIFSSDISTTHALSQRDSSKSITPDNSPTPGLSASRLTPLNHNDMPTVTSSESESRLIAQSERVLLEESTPVNIDSADTDSELNALKAVGDGIGSGFEDEESGDEGDDDDDDGSVSGDNTAGRKRRQLPQWVQDPFHQHVEECSAEHRINGLPSIYNQKSFMLPRRAPYFLLTSIPNITPQHLYSPQFFLWDPEALLKEGGIPCPSCRTRLHRHSVIPWPRRIVMLDSHLWIIGYRYRCRSCINPTTGKKSVTFRSWDPRILEVLPAHLASEFPAKLSHRSGVSKSLFYFMRTCFSNGVGHNQFSESIEIQHRLNYDRLHLQYLNFLAHRNTVMDTWRGQTYPSFPSFDDRSSNGPSSYVPGGQWFRDMYDANIEHHKHDFNQHTALLSAEICAIDHSHKIPKHIAKVNGERVFNGLLTVTNEKGEIRACNLVSTKAHSQYELALVEIRKSLALYGHQQPKLFYTDNMADKAFLESSFPSLCYNTVPVEKYSELPAFTLPTSINVIVLSDSSSINMALSTILDDLPGANIESDNITNHQATNLVVGFDTEWNFSQNDFGQASRGDIAVVQIVYQSRVYVLQISSILSKRTLPDKLIKLLSNPHIRKAGRLVSSDLRSLQDTIPNAPEFVGALDLATFAKQRLVISDARCSLADLCAVVLGRRLNKNVSERTSTAWENKILTQKQIDYAALDAYAPLLLYHELSKLSPPRSLPSDPVPGTAVLLFSVDNSRLVGRGCISQHFGTVQEYDHVRISSRRVLVEVSEVYIPGHQISSHSNRSLQSFGPPPFSVVYLRSHVRLCDSSQHSSNIGQHTGAPNPEFESSLGSLHPPSQVDQINTDLDSNGDDSFNYLNDSNTSSTSNDNSWLHDVPYTQLQVNSE